MLELNFCKSFLESKQPNGMNATISLLADMCRRNQFLKKYSEKRIFEKLLFKNTLQETYFYVFSSTRAKMSSPFTVYYFSVLQKKELLSSFLYGCSNFHIGVLIAEFKAKVSYVKEKNPLKSRHSMFTNRTLHVFITQQILMALQSTLVLSAGGFGLLKEYLFCCLKLVCI